MMRFLLLDTDSQLRGSLLPEVVACNLVRNFVTNPGEGALIRPLNFARLKRKKGIALSFPFPYLLKKLKVRLGVSRRISEEGWENRSYAFFWISPRNR